MALEGSSILLNPLAFISLRRARSARSEAVLEESLVSISFIALARRSSILSPVKKCLNASAAVSSVSLALLRIVVTSESIALATCLAISSSRDWITSSVNPAALYTLRTPSSTSSVELASTLLVAALPPNEINVPGSNVISRGSVKSIDCQNPISSPLSCII